SARRTPRARSAALARRRRPRRGPSRSRRSGRRSWGRSVREEARDRHRHLRSPRVLVGLPPRLLQPPRQLAEPPPHRRAPASVRPLGVVLARLLPGRLPAAAPEEADVQAAHRRLVPRMLVAEPARLLDRSREARRAAEQALGRPPVPRRERREVVEHRRAPRRRREPARRRPSPAVTRAAFG